MPHPGMKRRYYQMPKAEIAYLRYTLESYDGLAYQRTLDSASGLVEVLWPVERTVDVDALLAALSEELGWQEVDPPEVVPPI